MIRSTEPPPPVTMGELVTDPALLCQIQAARTKFQANMTWFESHAVEIGREQAGRFICIAGQELFVGDDLKEAIARARTAHPEDWGGFFTKRISTRWGG